MELDNHVRVYELNIWMKQYSQVMKMDCQHWYVLTCKKCEKDKDETEIEISS